MQELFDLFTKDSYDVMENARRIARDHGQDVITSNQLLAGLLSMPHSQGVQTLAQFSVRPEDINTRVKATIYMDAKAQTEPIVSTLSHRRYQFSAESVEVLRAAQAETAAQGIDYIDTRVLLLGLLRTPPAGAILRQFGISADEFRARAALHEPPINAPKVRTSPVAAANKPPVRPSLFFIVLVLFMVIAGYVTWAGIGDTGLSMFLFVMLGWVISVALHEFGHAIIAYIGGDESVVYKGYLTLDPLKYTHGLLSILLPIVFLLMGGIPLPGGAVYINHLAIRSRKMLSLTSAAGPGATLISAILLSTPFIFGWHASTMAAHTDFWAGVALLAFLQFFVLIINLLPIPGLDGFGILEPYLPPNILQIAAVIRPWGFFLLFFLLIYTPFGTFLSGEAANLMMRISFDTLPLIVHGFDLLFFWK